MKKHIEKLKKRSDGERKKMATIFAAVTTVIIVIIWLVVMSFIKPSKEKDKESSSFNILKKELSEISEGFPEIENKFNFDGIKSKLEDSAVSVATKNEEIGAGNINEEVEILE